MSWIFVYFLVKLSAISFTLTVITSLAAIGCVFGTVAYFLEGAEQGFESMKHWKPVLRKFYIVTIITGIFAMAVPTTEEAAVIWLLPKVINNEQVQQVPEKALKLLNQKMDKWLEDNLKLEESK